MVSIGRFFPDAREAQAPADVAVIMPTLMRPCIVEAVRCVFAQQFDGRIQIVVGLDRNPEQTGPLFQALEDRPPHVSAVVLTPPYSTSVIHGGVHPAWDGGALRTILSFLANSRYLAYLDDDNTWTPDHLASLHAAIQEKAWAYSLRMLVDEDTGEELGVDRWDAVGPNKGRFAARGGMVDPNCLMIDKLVAAPALWMWSDPGPDLLGREADRRVAAALTQWPFGVVERATALYRIRETNILRRFMREGVEF